MSGALVHALQPSAVHMSRACIQRALSRHALHREAVEAVEEPMTVPIFKGEAAKRLGGLDEDAEEGVHRAADWEEMMDADGDEEEPDNWVIFEGDVTTVSEFNTLAAERSYSEENPESEPVSRTSSTGSFEKLRRGKELVTGVVKEGVAKVGEMGDKLAGSVGKAGNKMGSLSPALGGTWDSADAVAERYAQQFEELVKLNAAMISNKSRATYQDACCPETWQPFEAKCAAAGDKITVACECMHKGAVMMSTQASPAAKAVSKAAKAARVKTPELPTYSSMRRGLKSAFGFASIPACHSTMQDCENLIICT